MTDAVTTEEKVEAKAIVAEATPPFSAVEAIAMIVDDYGGKHQPGSLAVSHDGMQIYFYNGTLVIRGSNERRDWFWNFFVIPFFLVGDSGIWWAYSALVDARAVFMWCKGFGPEKIKLIIGHSRGGAVAQIVGYSLGIAVWTFASPRVCLWGKPKLRAPITNHIIDDDPIRHFYPLARFVGDVERHRANGGSLTLAGLASNHRAPAYMEALKP